MDERAYPLCLPQLVVELDRLLRLPNVRGDSPVLQQPQGILFEIATTSPGFAVDEDPDHLGEELRLPKQHERLRSVLERTLTPLTNPRERVRS